MLFSRAGFCARKKTKTELFKKELEETELLTSRHRCLPLLPPLPGGSFPKLSNAASSERPLAAIVAVTSRPCGFSCPLACTVFLPVLGQPQTPLRTRAGLFLPHSHTPAHTGQASCGAVICPPCRPTAVPRLCQMLRPYGANGHRESYADGISSFKLCPPLSSPRHNSALSPPYPVEKI